MATDPDRPPLLRRIELRRILGGTLVETFIKAYGAGAATSVALSDSETVGGKSYDALIAIPNLVEQYRDAHYVYEHRAEIQAAADYLNNNMPPQAELEASTQRGVETLRDIDTTYTQLGEAKDAFPRPDNMWDHLSAAWGARPSTDSLRDLADLAETAGPLAEHAQALVPIYYGSLMRLTDNFASDEIVGTIVVMAVAYGVASTIAQGVGFWIRRGRPGLVASLLQAWGARTFREWYVDNLPHVSPPLYAAARERAQRDIVADPEGELGPEALREIERHFRHRRGEHPERD